MKTRIDYTQPPLLVPAPTVTLELDIDEFAALARLQYKGLDGDPNAARQVRQRVEAGFSEAIEALPDGWREKVTNTQAMPADDVVSAVGHWFDGSPTRWPP